MERIGWVLYAAGGPLTSKLPPHPRILGPSSSGVLAKGEGARTNRGRYGPQPTESLRSVDSQPTIPSVDGRIVQGGFRPYSPGKKPLTIELIARISHRPREVKYGFNGCSDATGRSL